MLRRVVLVPILAAATVFAGCGSEGGGTTFLSLGTGGTGGVYYPLGGALAARLSTPESGRQVTAEVTGGSVENINRIRAGQIDLGFALGGPVYEAFVGGEGFDAPFESLRIVGPLYPNLTHVLIRSDQGIATLGDARGRRVSVGSPGSGTEQVARQLLEAYGLSYDDVDERFLSFSESAAALRDGALDVAILSVGYPASAVLEALTAGGVELLPLDDEGIERLRARHPYHAVGRIPSGVYPGVDTPVPTATMMNWIVARDDLDPALVADVVNILGGTGVSLVQAHEMAAQI
ncbi:MAG: TAXI family TRAP transporter solute-binding subunit, partial [Longimicrobiales bacterium]